MLEHPLQLRIDDAGIVYISVGDKTLASGLWVASNSESNWTAEKPTGAWLVNPVTKVISSGGPGIIEQTYQGAVATHTFTVDGDDLLISSVIQNTGKLPISIPRVSGLTIHFARNASGYMITWHFSYTQQKGTDCMHPSGAQCIFGAAFPDDGVFGTGIHTPSHLEKQKLIRADYTQTYVIPKECVVQVDFNDPIEPGQSKTFSVNFHFAMASDWGKEPSWKTLLTSYRRDFQAQVGKLLYEPDDRPLAQFASADASFVKPDNPYGFNHASDRFDTQAGTQAFVEMVVPGLRRASGLGCIFWALAGWNPRGCMYRPDFDVFPPEVIANLPALVAGFKKANLRVGLATRPGEYVDRETWKTDETIYLCSESPAQMASLWKRFSNAIARGFDMFYMDSFPLTYDHHRILQFLRKKAGPKILFFTEEGTELSTAYAGRYLESSKFGEVSWTTPELLDIGRWLAPGASYACLPRNEKVTIEQLASMKLTPILPDYFYGDAGPNGVPIKLFRMNFDLMNGKVWK